MYWGLWEIGRMWGLALVVICSAIGPIILQGAAEKGYYWTSVYIGTPQVRRELVVDTGSALTSLACEPCASCRSHTNPPFNPLFSTSVTHPPCSSLHCTACHSDQCHFTQQFAEGSEARGVYIQDLFALEAGNETFRLSFGCHGQETGQLKGQGVDGVMGLAVAGQASNSSLLDAMKETGVISTLKFSICLGMEGGLLVFGGSSRAARNGQRIRLRGETHYEVQFLAITVGASPPLPTPIPLATLLDSGTTFVYFPDPLHSLVRTYFHRACEGHCGQPLTPSDEIHPCYEHTQGTIEEFWGNFPVLRLQLEEEWVDWEPQAYMYSRGGGLYCLGIYPSGGVETVLGSLFMRLREITFDRVQSRLTIYSSRCEIPSSD